MSPGRDGATGAGATGEAGWVTERCGLVGVDGRDGAAEDRDPRLPPPPAFAQASWTCAPTNAPTTNAPMTSIVRLFIVALPGFRVVLNSWSYRTCR